MKSLWLLTLTIVASLATVSPVSAQLAGNYAPPPGSYSWGPYVVTDDGFLTYDGDVAVRCKDLAEMGAPLGSRSDEESVAEPLTVEAVELCKEAGFPPSNEGNAVEDLAADEEDRLVGQRPPEYEVTRDGTLVIGGDMYAVDYCRLLAENPDRVDPKKQEYVEACAQAGFSPSDGEGVLLPETGGIDATVIIVVASVLAGSILAHRISR